MKLDEEFSKLMEDNKRFHDNMNSVNGIREWWHASRLEWKERRKPIDAIDQNIERYRRDIINCRKEEGHLSGSEAIRNADHRELLEVRVGYLKKERLKHTPWLTERAKLMRRVRRHFRELQLAVNISYAGGPPPSMKSVVQATDFNHHCTRDMRVDLKNTEWCVIHTKMADFRGFRLTLK
jgi:hypothetical protein